MRQLSVNGRQKLLRSIHPSILENHTDDIDIWYKPFLSPNDPMEYHPDDVFRLAFGFFNLEDLTSSTSSCKSLIHLTLLTLRYIQLRISFVCAPFGRLRTFSVLTSAEYPWRLFITVDKLPAVSGVASLSKVVLEHTVWPPQKLSTWQWRSSWKRVMAFS